MIEFLLTSGVIFAVLTGWQYVEHRYRRFANDHPALGPFRPEPGCGGGCSCSGGSCSTPGSETQSTTVSLADIPGVQAIGRE
ncbi:MAG: chemotaxis protein [Gammaproteobacteria bacterium]|nr:chemotaxis protein [Gammaproteobacteria bacterium]